MIPTRFRDKLPGYLTYPLGAEALSEALAGLPHAEDLSIGFSERPVIFASDFQRDLAERRPYTVLKAGYRPAQSPGISGSNAGIDQGWYDERWELAVFPVLRELRAAVKDLLLKEGLPAVAEWLRSSRRTGWEMQARSISLIFDPDGPSLSRAVEE